MSHNTITMRVAAAAYENHDDPLTAAEEAVAEEFDLVGWDLDPRWEDDQCEYILLTMQSRHITLRLAAAASSDAVAASRAVAKELGLVGWDLNPRWEDAEREYILIPVSAE